MIVTCENCRTKFNLEDRLLKENKVKVRCSRCGGVFWVAPDGTTSPFLSQPQPEPVSDLSEAGMDAPETVEGQPESEQLPDWLKATLEAEPETQPAEPEPRPDQPEPLPEPAAAPAATPQPQRPPAPPGPLRGKAWLYWSLGSIGVLALLVVGLGWWYYKMKPKAPAPASEIAQATSPGSVPPPMPEATSEEFQDLVIEPPEVRYRGLINRAGGQILVITGKLANRTPQPRGPIRLKATLTDSQNQPVMERLFYSGTTFTDDDLVNLSPEEINRQLDTPGGRSQGRIVAPGETQVFTGVLFGVPPNLAEGGYGYTLKVVQAPVAATP